jgi:hypothetical protein
MMKQSGATIYEEGDPPKANVIRKWAEEPKHRVSAK